MDQFRNLIESFEQNDLKKAEAIIQDHPDLLKRNDLLGRAVRHGNLETVKWAYERGAGGVQSALGYIIYGNKRDIAEYLISMGADMNKSDDYGPVILGACEVLNPDAMKIAVDLAEKPYDQEILQKCVAMVLSTYSRNPEGKHSCLALLESQGFEFADNLIMAFHRGDITSIKSQLVKNPGEINRLYSLEEIYPPEFGIKPGDGLHLTPLKDSSMLHMAVEYDEREVLQLLIDLGIDADIKAGIDEDGFGGHTALFHTVVSYTFNDSNKAQLLLTHGADPGTRATLRKQLRYMGDPELERMKVFNNVTPIEYARQFQVQSWVSEGAVELIKRYAIGF